MTDLPLPVILRLSHVPRWVIVPTLKTQTVADHSWRVAVISVELAQLLRAGRSFQLEAAAVAVFHDVDECLTGDVPASTKPSPSYSTMKDVDVVVKVADYFEALTWIGMWGHGPGIPKVEEFIKGRLGIATEELRKRWPIHAVNIVTRLHDLMENRPWST